MTASKDSAGMRNGSSARVQFLICQILSSDQTMAEIEVRVTDYAAMGVEHIWVIDPIRHQAFAGSAQGYRDLNGDFFSVPGSPIQIAVSDLWADLDELRTT